MQLGRYGFREVMNAHVYTLTGSTPIVYWPFANATNIEMNSDVTYATGGSGAPRRISYFGAKTGTVTMETQIFDMNILSILTGSDIVEQETSNIYKVSNGIVTTSGSDLTVTLPKAAIPTVTPSVYKFVNGVKSTKVGVVSYSGTSVVLDAADVADGDEVQVFYQWATADATYKLPIVADVFPPFVKIVGDSFFTDEITGELVDGQFTFYKARAMPNFTISSANSGDPTSLSIQFDLFAYDQADGSQPMLDIVLYDE